MNHGYFRDRISAYCDHELTPYEEKAMREHLAECEECRKLLEKLQKLDELVEKHSELGGEDYWKQSAQRIEEQLNANSSVNEKPVTKKPLWWGLIWKITTAAASIAVLTFIGFHQSDIYNSWETAPTKGEEIKAVSPPALSTKDRLPAPVAQKMDVIDDVEKSAQFEQPETRQEETNIKSDLPSIEKQDVPVEKRSQTNESLLDVTLKKETDSGITEKTEAVTEEVISDEETVVSKGGTQSATPDKVILSPEISNIHDVSANKDSKSAPMDFRSERTAMAAQGMTTTMKKDAEGNDAQKELAELDLEGWLQRRDSLKTLWEQLNKNEEQLTISRKSRKSLTSVDWVERQLLYSYYNVACFTKEEDKEKYDEAVDFLKEYIHKGSSRHPRIARDYLKRLGIKPN
ncbi:MAG: hypothetical protein DRP47_01800 [Candidatus Zixiibacteriota bacterium]|nr:MAG: hypothetical protein DRP47_01800 [candidate division Zixibacteria bacterium]